MTTQERINGFVIAQDVIHGQSIWKVRVKEPGHPFDQKKARIVNTRGEYQPKQGENVSFVIGSMMEGGHKILLAYDVSPAAQGPRKRQEPEQEDDVMNWFIVESDGKIYANCFGFQTLEEAKAALEPNDEHVLAFIPFSIREHLNEFDDPEIADAFGLVAALARMAPTLQALEKLVNVLLAEAIKASRANPRA